MAKVRPPTNEHRRSIEDSLRWNHFGHRPDDIFISTPPKSGTTWMQGIVASLLWPAGDAPDDPNGRSPWIDARFTPIENLLAHVDGQDHRRFIKTHSPADCVPIFEQCKYITVYRDGRDALMSWANHRGAMRPEIIEWLNASAVEEGLPPLPAWDGDMDELFESWSNDCSPITHLASWWPSRHDGFAYFAHYNDLKTDLEGEMRQIAAFLDIEVPEELWPEAVERCSISVMREDARRSGRVDKVFENGADAFFHKGTNDRWREVLTPAQLDRYNALVTNGLPADAARWLESGSLATGTRPHES
ncbi:MAG: aryl sulfotransferase [Acidimicrobiales bacterium]|jgi:aryl sulfotransferase